MAAIQKLSPEIIGKIAAGEVVERPASVVKELVENAIDAGATNVTVELRGGGVEYIRISDNGKGIPAEQIRLAFERHATSKLQRAEQLFDVHTLGFRGEALASVAAVAKVSCTTKTQEAAFGVRCAVEGGEFTDIRQAASPVGTTFIVEDLFFNTPVRRKFLKKPAVEAAMVSDYMLRLILSHPEIAFRFVSQGKTVYHSMGDGKLASALFCLYGKEALSQMIAVEGHMNGVLLKGYVGVGENARGNRQQQSFFVNGRFFRSAPLSRAVENGCEGRIMIGKFPMCALFLEVPYQNVDVNVHPNKLEVRFQDEPAVAEAVRVLTSEAMHGEQLGERLASRPVSAGEAPAANASFVSEGGFKLVKLNPAAEEAEARAPQPETGGDAPGEAAVSPAMPAPSASIPWAVSSAPMEPEGSAFIPASAVPAQVGGAAVSPAISGGTTTNAPSSPAKAIGDDRPAALLRPAILFAPDREAPVMRASTGVPMMPRSIPQPGSGAPMSDWAESASESLSPQTAGFGIPAPVSAAPQLKIEQTAILPDATADQLPRFVGIVFDTYWIFEAGERLLLIDQHAAHERILYDRLMKQQEGEQISQQLLSPQLVQLSPHDMALTEELTEVLRDSGFQVEPFDDHNVAIHAIPTLFGSNAEPKALFLEALDEWQAGRGQLTRERMRRQVAQMACKHAIKGGDKLNEQEIQGFLREMLVSKAMPTCPHGRPIVTEITRYGLEKRFKRVQ